MAGKIPQSEGSIEYGQKIVLGYYDQELEDLNENNTILEEVWNENDELTHTQVRNVLAQFLFTGEDVFKKVGVLSGGEKSRVALAKLMLSGANFLLLDEPTNHLDVKSREVLEEALLAYDGTLLAVSHDRYFVQKLASRILTMYQNGLENYQGDYSYYLEHRRLPESQTAVNGQVLTAAKKEHIESKEVKAKRRKLEKQLAACESEISAIEARLTEIEAEMSHEDASSDHILLSELHNEQVELESRLEKLYSDWSSYEEQLESLLS